MLPINEENKEMFIHWLTSFCETLKYEQKQDPNKTPYQVAKAVIESEIHQHQVMKEYFEYEAEVHKGNLRLLRAIKSVKGKTFYKYLIQIIEECDRVTGSMMIVKEPTGKFQEEKYGRQIPGIWVDQWSVGCEGDSWDGTVCVELKQNKFLKFSYSM